MNIYSYNQELQLASCCTVGIICSQPKKKGMKKVLNLYRPRNYAAFSSQSYYKYKTTTHKTRGQAASESSHVPQESSPDPVPSSIRAHNAQEINITNRDVTTWSCMGTGELSEPPTYASLRYDIRTDLGGCKIPKFSGGGCPQTPLKASALHAEVCVPMLCPSNSDVLAKPLIQPVNPSFHKQ